MLKRINKQALTEAIHSEEDMEKEINECNEYRKINGLCLVLLTISLLVLFWRDSPNQQWFSLFIFLFVINAVSSVSNNSRLELLEAIRELKRRPNSDA